jgi:hypothetical protein
MLLSTYDENCEATCPKCGRVHCTLSSGNLTFGKRYLVFEHEECGTKWRLLIDSGKVEIIENERRML